jgi:hypothetical protein
MTPPPTFGTRAPLRVGAKSFLLGLFVIWQLLFLFMSNVLPLIPHGRHEHDELTDDINLHGQTTSIEPVQRIIEGVSGVSDRWMEATGQLQGWSLFAPTFPDQGGFVAVQFRWDNGTREVVKSRFEPDDPQHFFRSPSTYDRLFNYESRFLILPNFWVEGQHGPTGGAWESEWREAITQRVQVQWKSMRAYLRWQLDRFLKEHPRQPPPTEVILIVNLYRTPDPLKPLWKLDGPNPRPLARWRPNAEPSPGTLPIEVCTNPAREHFEWIAPPN